MSTVDTGPVHYRVMPGRLRVRGSGDRRLHATVLKWDTATRLSNGTLEWFTRGREPPQRAAVLTLQHSGPRVGEVIRWESTPVGLNAMLIVDSSEIGDGLLALIDKHGELPLSPAFLGDGKRHDGATGGVQWRNLHIPELSVCAEAEFSWGRLRRWAP